MWAQIKVLPTPFQSINLLTNKQRGKIPYERKADGNVASELGTQRHIIHTKVDMPWKNYNVIKCESLRKFIENSYPKHFFCCSSITNWFHARVSKKKQRRNFFLFLLEILVEENNNRVVCCSQDGVWVLFGSLPSSFKLWN